MSTHPSPGRVALGTVAPLAGLGFTYLLWWISDRLLYVGPLDRAAFGWLVLIPIWALTPMAAAAAWRTMSAIERRLAAGSVGLVVTATSAILIWLATGFPACQYGPVRTPAEYIPPSIVVGLVIGFGFAGIGLGAARALHRAGWWIALLLGAVAAVGLMVLTVLILTVLISIPLITMAGCQRP